MTPLQTLKALVALQDLDVRIRELEKDRQQIPNRIEEIDSLLSQKKEVLSELRNQLDETEMARRIQESELKAEKEKIKKWEKRLSEIKDNRSYQALSRETEASRKVNLGLEDEILRKMQEIEDLKSSIGMKEEELKDLEKSLSVERAELEEKLNSINANIAGEDTVRNKAKDQVNARWYRQYQMIRKRRDGLAVVPVLDEHCQGCHVGIPPQLFNIVLRGESIEICPNCHRIMYFKPALDQVEGQSATATANE